MLRKTGAANVAALLLSLTPNPAQADDWWDRRDPVWQGDDAIHANGRAPTRDEAFERARVVLVAALRVGLPELDGELALRSAVLGSIRGGLPFGRGLVPTGPGRPRGRARAGRL